MELGIPEAVAPKSVARKSRKDTPKLNLDDELHDKTHRLLSDNVSTDEDVIAFRSHVLDIWLKNHESAKCIQELSLKASKVGASGLRDVGSIGASGIHSQNAARDRLRKVVKGCTMPPL